jgi:hypothetical protein
MIIRRQRFPGTPNRLYTAGRNLLGKRERKITSDSGLGLEKLGNVPKLIIS